MAQDERTAVGGPGLTVAIVLSLAMVTAGLAVPSTIGKFEGLFRSFGAELPWLTSTVLSYRIPPV